MTKYYEKFTKKSKFEVLSYIINNLTLFRKTKLLKIMFIEIKFQRQE